MTARDALRKATAQLNTAGCPSPEVDAEWLLADVLDLTRSELYVDGSRPLDDAQLAHFEEAVERRAGREPLAYILGEWGFRRLSLVVDRRVLVPRPETEVLVDRCLALLDELPEPRVLDIGVGSGAIALAIADEHPGARVVATDTAEGALAVAAENVARAGLEDRVDLVRGDLLGGVAGPFDLVVSNPPYVDAAEFDRLPPEIRLFEPRGALVESGVTERIAEAAPSVLKPDGLLVLETGDGAAGRVADALEARGYRNVTITADLAGRDRIVDGRPPR